MRLLAPFSLPLFVYLYYVLVKVILQLPDLGLQLIDLLRLLDDLRPQISDHAVLHVIRGDKHLVYAGKLGLPGLRGQLFEF
jgi:hypothetical protein